MMAGPYGSTKVQADGHGDGSMEPEPRDARSVFGGRGGRFCTLGEPRRRVGFHVSARCSEAVGVAARTRAAETGRE